jgi:lipid-binding SYLF domain-containing protein
LISFIFNGDTVMRNFTHSVIALASLAMLMAGCATAPTTNNGRAELDDHVTGTLNRLYLQDPGLRDYLSRAYGYVVFPAVGKGGLIAGGAYGRGEVFENGRFIGFADISQATLGAQIGGQRFAEVIAFNSPATLRRFEDGQFAATANASAVALKSGAAAAAKYENGVTIFVDPVAGLMVEAAVGGQSFAYQPD